MSSGPAARPRGSRLGVRILALLAGWAVLSGALVLAALGHAGALGDFAGPAGSHARLVLATALLVAGDAILLRVLWSDGGETSKVILGFFAVAGLFFSLFVFAQVRQLW